MLVKISSNVTSSSNEFQTLSLLNEKLPTDMQNAFPKIIGGGEFILDDTNQNGSDVAKVDSSLGNKRYSFIVIENVDYTMQ